MLSCRHSLPLSFEGAPSAALPHENSSVLTAHSQPSHARLVIDRNDRIVYTQYVADQWREPDYAAAMKAVHQAALE
jgi:hypothetical protein